MTVTRAEKAYEKYAWTFLLPGGLFYLVLGIGFSTSPGSTLGPFSLPAEELRARFFGLALIGLTIFGLATTLNSYRKGEKWSWYSLWYYPIFFGSILALYVAPATSDSYWSGNSSLFLILSLIGLLLPYRKFFPRK